MDAKQKAQAEHSKRQVEHHAAIRELQALVRAKELEEDEALAAIRARHEEKLSDGHARVRATAAALEASRSKV